MGGLLHIPSETNPLHSSSPSQYALDKIVALCGYTNPCSFYFPRWCWQCGVATCDGTSVVFVGGVPCSCVGRMNSREDGFKHGRDLIHDCQI